MADMRNADALTTPGRSAYPQGVVKGVFSTTSGPEIQRRLRLPWARFALGLALLASTVAPAARILHESAGIHVLCAEHGELAHLAFAPGHRGQPLGDNSVGGDASGSSVEADEHCPFASVLQQTSPEAKRASAFFPLVHEPGGALPLVPLVLDFRDTVLRNAPKTSPPYAG